VTGAAALADAATTGPAVSDQLVVVVGSIVTAAIAGATGLLIALVNARSGPGRTAVSPPPPAEPAGNGVGALRERVAVLEAEARDAKRRLDDHDEVLEIQDRRLDRHEQLLLHDGDGERHDDRT
jgi:hypothetical protein